VTRATRVSSGKPTPLRRGPRENPVQSRGLVEQPGPDLGLQMQGVGHLSGAAGAGRNRVQAPSSMANQSHGGALTWSRQDSGLKFHTGLPLQEGRLKTSLVPRELPESTQLNAKVLICS
jgi:hypothetical protein